MMMTNGHVHFFDKANAHAYDLNIGSGDGFRAVELSGDRVATVNWAGEVWMATRVGGSVSNWTAGQKVATLPVNTAFGIDYCSAQNKLLVSIYQTNRSIYSCDASTWSCSVLVSDYSLGVSASAFALKVDDNSADCSFYVGIKKYPAEVADILHYNGDGTNRQVFGSSLNAIVLQNPYAIGFESEAP